MQSLLSKKLFLLFLLFSHLIPPTTTTTNTTRTENLTERADTCTAGSNCYILDNLDSQTFMQNWVGSTNPDGFCGSNYFTDNGGRKGLTLAIFSPILPQQDLYEVSMRWPYAPTNNQRAESLPVTINTVGGAVVVKVNQKQNGGIWNKLGVYELVKSNFNDIVLNTKDTTGEAVVDAIKICQIPAGGTTATTGTTAHTSGTTGSTATSGTTGSTATTGSTGTTGTTGTTATSGTTATTGTTASTGTTGSTGTIGSTGITSETSVTTISGTTGLSSGDTTVTGATTVTGVATTTVTEGVTTFTETGTADNSDEDPFENATLTSTQERVILISVVVTSIIYFLLVALFCVCYLFCRSE